MDIKWWEIRVDYHPELEDSVFWRLQEFGCQGAAVLKEERGWVIKGYVPNLEITSLDLAALALWIKQDFVLAGKNPPVVAWQLIPEQDWASSWKQHWQPLDVGDRFSIYPAWIEPPSQSERIIIRLDPGFAFGTGVHPTTQLCLESLEMRIDETQPNQIVADIGCGSGILSIAASMLGASKVFAVDTDPLAVSATLENSRLNQVYNIVVIKGSIEDVKAQGELLDGIVCNILAEVIKPMIPDMTAIIKPDGWTILSGILLEQSNEIVSILEKHGWTIAALWQREGWCCVNARRS
ncbi:MAG: 50S ribosomal protein L11 methyltransferase [Geminocystis sp.]|nr:50S ribosomal protein L11 methyltransferase [Geminocystis sp.]HIK36710.1 50S ribosomal protein L11 methyltransferase [Geminocystis sp. M7585_C2015_104]MCS7146790.1 50S ribosomal protein L11 methyltransferase [Geminocystis sp.]MCX8077060.1 50S ribosomal protein L11 methyltransferase [Geminocystis sp.]MDW8115616.1 50S ribosomal protein L11 methyltransferase [Geminocystis sp.]